MATKNVQIGGANVGMLANGASPFIYKTIFKDDFIQACAEERATTALFVQMGFVLAMQYEHGTAGALKKTEADFYKWLESFDMMEPEKAAVQIAELCTENERTASVPKGGAA